MTKNQELCDKLKDEGWIFLRNITLLQGQRELDHAILRQFTYPIDYRLVERTDVTYSLFVSNNSYHKANEIINRTKERV